MTTFLVAFDASNRRAYVLNQDGEIPAGSEEIGTFEADIDPETGYVSGRLIGDSGDHIFIEEARKLVEEQGVSDFQNLIIEDRVSNEPRPDKPLETVKEVEQEHAADLHERDITGTETTTAGEPHRKAEEAKEKAESKPKKKAPAKAAKK